MNFTCPSVELTTVNYRKKIIQQVIFWCWQVHKFRQILYVYTDYVVICDNYVQRYFFISDSSFNYVSKQTFRRYFLW